MRRALQQSDQPGKTIGISSSEIVDINRDVMKALAYQHFKQTVGFYPDSDPGAFDRRNVRDGHYYMWIPLHVMVRTSAGDPITTVTYEKAVPDYLPTDSQFYKFTIRLKPPNAPFTKLYFKAHQYCNGIAAPTEWVGLPDSDAGAEPAAELVIMPARQPGWNKYTVPVDIKDLSIFKDALIVWKGNAAYSANANTTAQITAEPGATPLTELKANDEVWVRY